MDPKSVWFHHTFKNMHGITAHIKERERIGRALVHNKLWGYQKGAGGKSRFNINNKFYDRVLAVAYVLTDDDYFI